MHQPPRAEERSTRFPRVHHSKTIPWCHTTYNMHLDMSHHYVQLDTRQKHIRVSWKNLRSELPGKFHQYMLESMKYEDIQNKACLRSLIGNTWLFLVPIKSTAHITALTSTAGTLNMIGQCPAVEPSVWPTNLPWVQPLVNHQHGQPLLPVQRQ